MEIIRTNQVKRRLKYIILFVKKNAQTTTYDHMTDSECLINFRSLQICHKTAANYRLDV